MKLGGTADSVPFVANTDRLLSDICCAPSVQAMVAGSPSL